MYRVEKQGTVVRPRTGDSSRSQTLGNPENKTASSYRYHNDTDINNRTFFMLSQAASDPEEQELEFCQVAFGKLHWTFNSTYHDLWSQCLQHGKLVRFLRDVVDHTKKKVTIVHAVTKTGSTSVRLNVIGKMRRHDCDPFYQAQGGRPVLQRCESIPNLTSSCQTPPVEIVMFGPRQNDLAYPQACFDYSSSWPQLEQTHQFIHTIAYRDFYEWAHSAMNHVVKSHAEYVPEVCDNFRRRFAKCWSGRMELDFYKYTKNVLRTTLQEASSSSSSSSQQPILLHHYRSSTVLQTVVRERMGLEPLNMTAERNSRHINLTCPDDILQSFHACFDHLL